MALFLMSMFFGSTTAITSVMGNSEQNRRRALKGNIDPQHSQNFYKLYYKDQYRNPIVMSITSWVNYVPIRATSPNQSQETKSS